VANVSVQIRKLSVRRGGTVSAAKVVSAVNMSIPKKSVGTMRITIVKGAKYCTFVGTHVRGVGTGVCSITVAMIPKKGKKVTRTTTLTVR
jgi:hypothetical protein